MRRVFISAVVLAFAIGITSFFVPMAEPVKTALPSFLPPNSIVTGGLGEPNIIPGQRSLETNPESTTETEKPAEAAPAPAPTINIEAPSPVEASSDVAKDLEQLTTALDKIESAIEGKPRDDRFLANTRPKIEKIIEAAKKRTELLTPRLSDIEKQVEKLGPEPKDGEPAETEQVAEERKRVNQQKAQIEGAIKTAKVIVERAQQLAGKTLDLRQRLFADAVLARGQSPLSPSLWSSVVQELPAGMRQLSSMLSRWGALLATQIFATLAMIAAAFAIFFGIRHVTTRARARGLEIPNTADEIPFYKRASTALWVTITNAAPLVLSASIVFFGLRAFGLLTNEISPLFQSFYNAVLLATGVWALARAILQPRRPAWRLFDIPSGSARKLTRILTWMAIVYGGDLFLQDLMQALLLPLPVRVAEAALVTLAFAALMFAVVRTRLADAEVRAEINQTPVPGEPDPNASAAASEADGLLFHRGPVVFWRPKWLKVPTALIALGITAAGLLGYVALGRFVAGQVIVASAVAVLGFLIIHAIRAFTVQSGPVVDRPMEYALRRYARLNQPQASLLTRSTSVLLQAILPLLAVPVLFLSWGYSFDDAASWLKSLFFGFRVGDVKISLVHVALTAGLFVALLFITRLLQGWITRRVTTIGKFDHGVVNSIHTTIGYLGVVLAAIATVSYAGFDITNLAIVAGALSVGIGFGLQSIVNNFVSGLIILFERPIKVGDWVLVNNYEGYVRRISVRSTELETFDRTNVIVPNAEFISNPIVNLTHRNALGRVTIPVGVSYNSDPKAVRELLAETVQASSDILDTPPAIVTFDDFGASSLDFTVRAYIEDVNQRLSVASNLRVRIFEALKAAGIEIPFPQQDLHIRDLDPLKAALSRSLTSQRTKDVSNPQ